MVKDLREQTGVGMMECKKALQESEGDMKRAVELLREKGAAKAVKRAGRAAKEGRIAALISEDNKKGVLVEVNSETDFAARNEKFGVLVDTAAATALEVDCADVEALLQAKPVQGDAATIQQLVTDTIGVIGENMGVGRCASLKVPDGKEGLVHSYIHPPGTVGVLVALCCENASVAQNTATDDLAHEICLQVAFSNPQGLSSDDIPEDVVAAEREIYKQQALQSGKPEKVIDKIIDGRMKSFFKEVCLLDQGYVKEEKQSVSQLVQEVAKEVGGTIEVTGFLRFQLGEGAGEEEE